MDDGEFLLEQKRGLGADGSAALKQEETAVGRRSLMGRMGILRYTS